MKNMDGQNTIPSTRDVCSRPLV